VSVPLSRIVDRLRREDLLGADNPTAAVDEAIVSDVTTDSRMLQPGALFCAIRGVAGDGHSFLGAASQAGAVAALVESPDRSVSLPQIVVKDGRKASAHAAAEFYRDPWKEVMLIGVTGTNGKTTTVSILRHLMGMSRSAASIGTLGLIGPDGRIMPGTEGLTTPGPAQLARAMRRLVDEGVRSVAMEVSSHALEQQRVSAASFAAAIFTNLSRDHLDYHPSLEAYREAKLKLVDLIRPGGVLVTNIDDPAWDGVRRDGVHLVRYGTQGRGEIQAQEVSFGAEGAEWKLITPSCTADVHLPLFGVYNVSNALGAAAALWALGWPAEQIAEGFTNLRQVPGRLERIEGPAGVPVVIDYAHTPDALERALRALRPLTPGRLIVVFGAGGNRDKGKRPQMGRVASELADLAIVTTDNPRNEDPITIIEAIESGMGAGSRKRIVDRREAIAHAIDVAVPGDLILLAGKGHETYQIWGNEQRPFDERLVVEEILKQKAFSN
jgi:UDP-N-acetylmuramoyl-L-alanyl-D-glutamate--2,6-diaminopimelate ligase